MADQHHAPCGGGCVAAGVSMVFRASEACVPALRIPLAHRASPCPLCGLTRAMFALAKGHWSEALGFNALGPLAFAMVAGLFWNDGPMRRRVWTCGIAAFAIYGVWRIFLPVT